MNAARRNVETVGEASDRDMEVEREAMIAQVAREAQATEHLTGRPAFHPQVMAAMRKVPRQEFVPKSEVEMAYINAALPIGCGQTISQPYIVALMTDLLNIDRDSVVLDIGTGSGYQAAVLAEIASRVYSIEVIEELAAEALVRLRRLGYENIVVRASDGSLGCPEHAPFDGILVAATTSEIPQALIDQLKPGARLVIPVDRDDMTQDLVLVEKDLDGKLSERSVIPVSFVRFKRPVQPVKSQPSQSVSNTEQE